MPVQLHCFLQETHTIKRGMNQHLAVWKVAGLRSTRLKKIIINFLMILIGKFLPKIINMNCSEGQSGSISHLCYLDKEVCMASAGFTPSV